MKLYELEIIKDEKRYKRLMRAENLNIAQAKALNKNWKIINIKEKKKNYFRKINSEYLILFFKELSLLCEAGLSIQEAFKELMKIHSFKSISRVLDNLLLGQNLSLAFENADFGLNYAELALIKTAENTGKLSENFLQIAKLREKNLENQKRFKKAIRYPLFVFISVCVAFIFLMLFVIPNFKDLFENLNVNLPLITIIILQIYNFLQDYILIFAFLLVFIFILVFLMYKKSYSFAYICDFIFLKIPLFSNFIVYSQNYYFFMVFSLLLKNGISLSKAFNLSILGLQNKQIISKYKELLSFIDSGLEIGSAFKKIDIFDPLVLSMLNIAMKSSKLEFLSEEISKYYENKMENLMDRFLILLEPLMTLFVAMLVLFLALGIFLPIWELSSEVNL
ncbi:type II secretion system F family protein [Campylobacter estrildidarum]|uniref:Type II secretion system F family protein n=1 Tax=Campylobacter estrildidarum TaxID=2510189 RepID=A0A4U7BHX0_9BACT|nr:type II secretion system F family protein [Campylobacter estrildidarum]TKX31438.1 type II secretion system F family protein [Campylobacter estrildidarum]